MVQITDEDLKKLWEREKKGDSIDGLTQYDIDLIGAPVRIHIPMTDKLTLELAAELLRGLANEIEFTLQRQDIPLRVRLQMLKSQAMLVNARIRDRYSRSQPK